MATGNVIITVLDVGQGQGTFVEIYDTNNNLTNTLLFDLGSAKGSWTAGESSIDYVAAKIATMSTPKIDYMSLSHKDRDHVNLLDRLICSIKNKINPKVLVIGKIRYGGAKEWYSNNLIGKLATYCNDIQPLKLRHSAYNNSNSSWEAIWAENDVYVYIILANIPTDSNHTDWSKIKVTTKVDSELANSVSIISSVYYANSQFFICGDATFVTFQEFNKLYSSLTTFDYVKMVTMPHHGSRKTTLGLSYSSEEAEQNSIKVVETFAQKIGAKTITASAEIFGKYHHPSLDIMLCFAGYADSAIWYYDPGLDGNNRHYITAFIDITLKNSAGNKLDGRYSSFETEMNVYSTLYNDPGHIDSSYLCPPCPTVGAGTTWTPPNIRPAFPNGVRWYYSVESNGNLTLSRETSRTSGLSILSETISHDLASAASRVSFPLGNSELKPAEVKFSHASVSQVQGLKRMKVLS